MYTDEEDLKMKKSIYQLNTSHSNSFLRSALFAAASLLFCCEREMLCCQFQWFFALLVSLMLLLEVSAAPQPDMLMETLGEDFTNNKDFTPFVLLKFISELRATRLDEMLPDQEEVLGIRQEVMRRHLPLASYRERKAGCRNFFWKTFTSC
ncbi:somatostatin-1 [Halichoeres trimaculatus]|uniref:somatostatin-1 n=1 Tax=Halichoeres trimaculatus TaxID=147232 RepID=UPI003D9DCAAA